MAKKPMARPSGKTPGGNKNPKGKSAGLKMVPRKK